MDDAFTWKYMKAMQASGDIWPTADLEFLGQCPVCACTARLPLHDPMTDRLFQCAPGEWQLHTCQQCELAYLDPRPSMQSIGRAYERYFTHGDITPSKGSGWQGLMIQRLKNTVAAAFNDFRNKRWGMKLHPSIFWGNFFVSMIPPLRSLVIAHMRRIPPRPPYQGAKLLDVGCGDGAFLEAAQAAGWHVTGIDFDAKAVAAARLRGVQVICGDLDVLKDNAGGYEYITCSHVIEHVHNPSRLMSQMRVLLAPNGRLWLQTPNLESIGHSIFGVNWRDLDPPRHLCLFTPKCLRMLVNASGLHICVHRLPTLMAIPVYSSSLDLAKRKSDVGIPLRTMILNFLIYFLAFFQAIFPNRAEFITITARRSD
ncbi:MAG: class I SAM-dependent methyltransferase [Rhodoferax sp.]|nr:class I SAM-dependent methyltransferase [Rhodoferax sp.]